MAEETLAYDLRQRYADIVGRHLEIIADARLERNYPAYFEAMEDLVTVMEHKFKHVKKKFGDKEQTDYEYYTFLMNDAITKANKYKSCFLGTTAKPEEVRIIRDALRKIEMFLYKVMDTAKMFGTSGFNEGM